ncbi:MAG: VWA domain-containing protein [Deltaproteobacteria bacterium]|nr:VWA domain-containing protein [Deltaproteobacteria bacterium]
MAGLALLVISLLGPLSCNVSQSGFLSVSLKPDEVAPNGKPVTLTLLGEAKDGAALEGWAVVTGECGYINGVPAAEGAHVWVSEGLAQVIYRCDVLAENCCQGVSWLTTKMEDYSSEAAVLLNCELQDTALTSGLDIYIMMDQSGSMDSTTGGGETYWEAVTKALVAFLEKAPRGVSVGIQYFALGDDCDPAPYSQPDVEISPLPASLSSLKASIAAHSPSTMTPTYPALQGAIQHAKDWARAHPKDVTIALLATDGEPSECEQDISLIAQLAADGYSGDPSIRTFVIGIGGNTGNLNPIAAAGAGGVGEAIMVDTNANAQQQFLDALNAIRAANQSCEYPAPQPAYGDPDYSKVNVKYTSGTGADIIFPRVDGPSACSGNADGWYFDNPNNPTQVILCNFSCLKLSSDPNSVVNMVLGCDTATK